jgi:phytoene desaturase
VKKVAIIGSGFSGLSAAACLAKEGYEVTVFEKNDSAGGRARRLTSSGFTFDMGPSFYWMPDVFDRYFSLFGKKVSDYYELKRLDPSYRLYFGSNDHIDVPVHSVEDLFETLEGGSSQKLRTFLNDAKIKYDIGMKDLVYKPGLSLSEFASARLLLNAFRLHLFSSVSSCVRKFFSHPRIIQMLEFPMLFLGAAPKDTPALYTLMNYADIALGTWYPNGGMYKVVEAMVSLARELGVKFHFNSEVSRLSVKDNRVDAIFVNDGRIPVDRIVATADYHHVEQSLLPPEYRRYTGKYWQHRVMAPSALMFYIGLNKKLANMCHHTLFFDEDFDTHAREIYRAPQWPEAPQFYVSCTSVTDPAVAPVGCENLVVLIPVASGLDDTPEVRQKYFDMVIHRLEKMTGQSIRNNIVFNRSYAHADFIRDYHAWKGNAYGLANTLRQTAHLRPSIINKKVRNLFYAGQLTVPGPGIPPAIISGEVVAKVILNLEKHDH